MTSKSVQSRKDEILNNFFDEYADGKKEEERLLVSVSEWDDIIKGCIEISDEIKQELHEAQMKNARNKGYLRGLFPKYQHKCKYSYYRIINL